MKISRIFLSCILTAVLTFPLFSAGLTGKKIMVDPGHGGSDSGAVGPTGLKEKDVTLQVSLKLKDHLYTNGDATVNMTRTEDTYPSLSDRTTLANSWGADRFLSVHFNAVSDRSVNGTETFYYTLGSANSKDLATKLQLRLLEVTGLANRGVKTADYYVLKYTNMPAALTETSFISNSYEEARLKDITYVDRIARAHYVGLTDHYNVDPNLDPPSVVKPLSGRRVVIDAAAGGSSNGSVGPTGLKAKDVNLGIAAALKNTLINIGGAEVVMTRETDTSLTAAQRTNIANTSNADRLVSISLNGASDSAVNYTKTYYNDDGTDRGAASIDLAKKVQAKLKESLGLTDKGTGSSSAALLAGSVMPGILVRPGHITNPFEEARLKDSAYISKIGLAVYTGLELHLNPPPAVVRSSLEGLKFVIDPASGGSSSGSKGPTGLLAKNVNLRIATVLKNNLVEYGKAAVVMTRDTDIGVTTADRVATVNSSGADRLVSVSINGSTTYPDNNYIKSYYHNDGTEKGELSKDLAQKVQSRIYESLKIGDNGVSSSTSAILKDSNVAGILTRPSFITNPYEEARLKDDAYTWKIGRSIYLGVADHFGVK